MKRTAKKIIVAVAIAAVSVQSAPIASACGGRGSRIIRHTRSYGYPAPVYRQPVYSQPICHQPAPPVHFVTPRPVAPITVAAVQPRPRAQVAQQTAFVSRSAAAVPTAAQGVPAQRAATQPVARQPVTTPAANRQALATPTANRQAVATQAATQAVAQTSAAKPAVAADAEVSALAALASISAATVQTTAVAPAAQPARVAAAPAQATTQPAVPQFSAAPVAASTNASPHVGSFKASLPSNVTIELNLNNGGTFSWVVRGKGKTTQFSGQYQVTQGRLTLVRSNDLQQMAGKLTAGQNGFTFKLDGADNGGLNFKKV